MENFKNNIDKICLYQEAKLDLLQKYMSDWIEARSRVSNACFMNFEYNTFDRWLSTKLKLKKAIDIYGEDVVAGNIGGMKFDITIKDRL